jgi:hypothetical protein
VVPAPELALRLYLQCAEVIIPRPLLSILCTSCNKPWSLLHRSMLVIFGISYDPLIRRTLEFSRSASTIRRSSFALPLKS